MTVLGTITGQVRLDIRQAVAAYAALRAQNARTTYALRGTGDSFVAAGQRMAVAGGVMVYAFSRVVNAAAEFERKMDFASAVSGTTGQKMQELSDYALKLGQDTIYSAGQIAEGFIELAKAGVSAEQIIGGIGEAMTNLGAAGDIPLAESGQIITSTIQQFDLAAKDAVKVTDLLAGAANASIADITDIGVSLKYVGGVANAVGLTFEDTSTAISLLAKAGIRGSTAGTSLRQMLVSLGGATEPAEKSLERLGIITEDGSNKFFTAEGKAKSLSQVFQILQDSTADLTQKQRLMELRTIFNNRALSAASILTREGAKGFKDMNREMLKTTAADVARERLDNLSGDIEILRGNIETMMIQAGSPFQKTLRGWVQGITSLIQGFSELDPAMQEGIVKMIALSGVALVVMGAVNIVIGTIFRFAAAMLKMAAGMKFAARIVKILFVNLRWAAVLLGGPMIAAIGAFIAANALLIAAVVGIVAALVIAYRKSEAFRNVVNSIVGVIVRAAKAFGNWLKLLMTDPGAAWEQLKAGVEQAVTYVVTQINKLPGLIERGLAIAGQYVGQFVDRIIQWFQSLPGRAASALVAFGVSVMTFFQSLPGRVGYAIGFLVGFIVRQLALMPSRILAVLIGIPTLILNLFATLAPRIGYLLGFLIGKVVGFFIRLGLNMIKLTLRAVLGVINFFRTLPGRVASFISQMVVRGIALFNRIRTEGPRIIAQMVTGAINFIRTLPSRAVTFFTQLYTKGVQKFNQLKTQAVAIAGRLVSGFVDGIKGLPAQASGIVDQAIEMFKQAATRAFNAAKEFASGLWEGFKDGLGINSPSLIEKQMWQITKVTDEETKKMANQTMKIQAISRKLAKTTFSVGDPGAPSSAQEYRRLAVMQSRNQKRAETLASSVGNRQARNRPIVKFKKGPSYMEGTLLLHPDGTAMIAGIAEDVYDRFEDDNRRRGNM